MSKFATAIKRFDGALIAERGPGDVDCTMEYCRDRATRSGLCEECLMVVATMLKHEIRTLDSLVAKPAVALQHDLAMDDILTTLGQCNSIKCFMVEAWRTIPQLHGDMPCPPLNDALLKDFGRSDVADTPENRARRAAFFGALPNRWLTPNQVRELENRPAPVGFSATELVALDRLHRQALRHDGVPTFEHLPSEFGERGLCVLVLVGLVVSALFAAAQFLLYGGKH
jgi:hypothetical protein